MNPRSARTTRFSWPALLVWLTATLLPLKAAEGVDMAALRSDTDAIAAEAERAKAILGSASEIEPEIATLRQLVKQIEDEDYRLRMAISKTQRLERDFDAKEAELNRVKQHMASVKKDFDAQLAQLQAQMAEIEGRYPPGELPEPQYSAWKREADDWEARKRRYNAEVDRVNAERQPAWDRVFQQLSAVQRELHEATQQRDRAAQTARGLIDRWSGVRTALGGRIQAARKMAAAPRAAAAAPSTPETPATPQTQRKPTPAAPANTADVRVPLTPFQNAPSTPPKFDPRDGVRVHGSTALEQAAGARVATQDGLRGSAGERTKYNAGMRFDSPEGRPGRLEESERAQPVEVRRVATARRADTSAIPRPPPLTAAMADSPAVQQLVQAQEKHRQEIEKLRAERDRLAAEPDRAPPGKLAEVVNRISQENNQLVFESYLQKTLVEGSKEKEEIDLEIDLGDPEPPPPPPNAGTPP